MKTLLLFIPLLVTAMLQAAELPTGQTTPEGVACDAIGAYIRSDSKAWLATLVRPIYGEAGNKEYAKLKKQMVATTDRNKKDKTFRPPRIVKCYKARQVTMTGQGVAAFTAESLTGNMFVDVLVELAPGRTQQIRYHVLKDKDAKWYFEPSPDLCPLLSKGLNAEPESTEVLYESSTPRAEPQPSADQIPPGGPAATTVSAGLPAAHPLRHPGLVVIQQPTSFRREGAIDLHELMGFVLGSEAERIAACAILEREGYGPRGRHYLYCGDAGKPAVADGRAFATREEALEYFRARGVTVAFYFSTETSFPATIPGELTYRGTGFRVLERSK